MTRTPAPLASGATILPVRPRTAAAFVGLWPTTRARPPSARASRTRRSAAPSRSESSPTSSGSASRSASSAPLPAFWYAARHLLTERGEEAGERLRRALGAGRNRKVVAAAKAGADLKRCRHPLGGE